MKVKGSWRQFGGFNEGNERCRGERVLAINREGRVL